MKQLLRQHVKDTVRALRHGYTVPALWETRHWLELVQPTAAHRSHPTRCGGCAATRKAST